MPVFKPTKAMKRARYIVQRSCPPEVLKTLRPDDPQLPHYAAPFPITTIQKWVTEHTQFWQWFLTPCDYEPKFLEAKELALQFYISVLRTPHQNEEGVVDKNVLNAKLKVAERLVGSKEDKAINLSVSQNTNNLNTGGKPVAAAEAPMNLPQTYKRNPGLLAGKVSQLREARMERETHQEEDLILEGEEA